MLNATADCPAFVRIDVGHEQEVADFLAMSNKSPVIPMLFAKDSRHHHDIIIDSYLNVALKMNLAGFNHVVLAADNDGAWQRSLSPRNNESLKGRMMPFLNCYRALVPVVPKLWVCLTIEELAPGGFDASDGIAVLQELRALGLNTAIVSAGSRDFMPLFKRRSTIKKSNEIADFPSREPSLASAQWALSHTDLKIWALMPIDNDQAASALAKDLGLKGLIRRAF
jgi:hypothetical protein